MRRIPALAAIALLAAACAHGASGTPSEKGHLHLSQEIVGPLYVEGSTGYVSVSHGTKDVYTGSLAKSKTIDLAAGMYTVTSYQRLCIGTCSHLGPPIDRCSASVNVTANATTAATVELTPTKNACAIAIPA
jgi:hypothetical protein